MKFYLRRRSIDCNDGRHGGPIKLIEAERLDDGWMLEPAIEVICNVFAADGGSELGLEMLIKMRKASHVWFKDQENSFVNSSRLECKPSQARRIWTFSETFCL